MILTRSEPNAMEVIQVARNQTEIVSEGLMSVRNVARFLGVSRSLVYELMGWGELPWVKLGRARRIPRRAVVDLAARRLIGEG